MLHREVAGIRIEASASWRILLALLTSSLAARSFPLTAAGLALDSYWLVDFSVAELLFVSMLLHELVHSLPARAGLQRSSSTFVWLGEVSILNRPHAARETIFSAALPSTRSRTPLKARLTIDTDKHALPSILVGTRLAFRSPVPGALRDVLPADMAAEPAAAMARRLCSCAPVAH